MKKIYCLLFAATLFVSACDPKEFDDINVDPTTLQEVPTKALLTNTLQDLPSTVFGINTPLFYVQHLSEGPYPGASLYNNRNFAWSAFYAGPLFNLQSIINFNNDPAMAHLTTEPVNGSKANQIAVARILKAYYFWWLTDRYGDIPYSEALKGEKDFTPKYDTQKDIYYDLFKELKEAQAQINLGEPGVTGDILLNGDMAAWKQFANTCRLYMSLRLIKNDFAKGQVEFNSAIADGLLTSNADNIVYDYIQGDPNNWNPWYQNYSIDNRNDYAISATLATMMNDNSDKRVFAFGETLGNGTVKGLPYGSGAARQIPGTYSRVSAFFRSSGSDAYVFTYAQTLFALAEAAKVGYVAGGDAQAAIYYNNALKASWEQYGVYDATTFAAFTADADIIYTPSKGLEQIIVQKWTHQYMNGYEAWADWKRTGFPVLTSAAAAVDPRGIPRRQGYPSNESALNGANYTEVIARQGADDNYTRMWWDK